MCLYLLMNYTITIPNKTCVKAYLQHIYATVGGSLTIIMDSGKEFKNELFQKCAMKLGIKHQFSSPHHPQPSGILEIPFSSKSMH